MLLPAVAKLISSGITNGGISRAGRIGRVLARSSRTLRCGAFLGKIFKLLVALLTAYQIRKAKNQLMDDVKRQDAEREVEKATNTLSDVKQLRKRTKRKLKEKQEFAAKATDDHTKFTWDAKVHIRLIGISLAEYIYL